MLPHSRLVVLVVDELCCFGRALPREPPAIQENENVSQKLTLTHVFCKFTSEREVTTIFLYTRKQSPAPYKRLTRDINKTGKRNSNRQASFD